MDMLWKHIVTHGLFFGLAVNGYLLLTMLTTSPRVWGYADYSDEIKAKIPPQTAKERRTAWLVGIPWFIFIIAFPFYSTYALKTGLGGEIPYWAAFLNVVVLVLLATLGDLVILDWLIISVITPRFVIIPGTEPEDYKDFSHHFKGHARAVIPLLLVSVVISAIVWFA
jgi:hypothetical protein